MSAPDRSFLDPGQVLQHSFDDATGRIRVDALISATIVGAQEVIISETDDSIAVYGTDGAVNRQLKTDASGELQIAVVSSALPTGASTSALQTSGNASLSSIDSDIDIALSTRASESTLSTLNSKVVDDYGSSVTAVRTASQIGNATGAAAFNAGTTTAQTIRVVLPTDQTVIPINDNGGSLTVDGIVAATQSGIWNINNISGTVSLPTGASTAALQTQPGVDIGDVTVNNASGGSAVNIQDGGNIITVDGTVAVTQSTSPWVVAGNIASAATDSGNPVKVGAVYNSTDPTFTNGQRGDLQLTSTGRLKTEAADASISTYSAAILGLVPPASATDIFTITGSGTKTVTITKIQVSATRQSNGNIDLAIIKRSTANSGGTSTTPTQVQHDTNDAAATATVRAYTVNPTLGTTVGTVRVAKIWLSTSGGDAPTIYTLEFGSSNPKGIILRGTSQVLSVNLNAVTVTTPSFDISIEWTEE